jgi:ankyrin repeat protein
MIKKYIILLLLATINPHAIQCMNENKSSQNIVECTNNNSSQRPNGFSQFAAYCNPAIRNQLRLVNKQWYTIASKSNKEIFLCNPVKLGKNDQSYFMYYFADEPSGAPVIKNLLKNDCLRNPINNFFSISPLLIALQRCNYETAQLLNKNNYGYQPIHTVSRLKMALYKGDKNELKLILDIGISLELANSDNTKQMSPAIYIPASLGHTEAVAYLLEYCKKYKCEKLISKTTKEGNSAFHAAAENGHLLIIEMLLPHFDINHSNNEKWTALHFAALNGHDKIVKFLLANKANAEIKTNDTQETPILTASKFARYACVKLLLEHGANITVADNSKDTLLNNIAQHQEHDDQIGIAKILIAKEEIDINAKNSNDKAALHSAALSNSCALAKLLLDNGAKINMRGTCGRTPLHEAAPHGYENLIKLLLKRGANKYLRDNFYRTAYDSMKEIKDPEIAEALNPYQQNSR